MPAEIRKKLLMFWRSWGWSLLLAFILATSFRSAIADWNIVPTGSMKPTILEGDRIFVNKLAYDLKVPYTTRRLFSWDNPSRGDIVVFFSPADGVRLVKRVIGLPGDIIAMSDNRLYINGETIDYQTIPPDPIWLAESDLESGRLFFTEDLAGWKHTVMITPDRPARDSFNPFIIPRDSYFMMGDNRDESADSRYFGLVDRRLIVGRAMAVVMSLRMDKHYLPRRDRFFKKLL